MINDEKITNLDMIRNYTNYDLENIQIPVLIIHARDDPLASFDEAEEMGKRVPDSKFVAFENGGHLVFGHSNEVQQLISGFIDDC
ncbi:MAG: alpha/beta fold hydrolase [Candidatus Hodarchaeales archaeon]